MMESIEDTLAKQRETPGSLARLIAGVPDAVLRQTPGAGGWSVVEVVAHLAEDELASSWRYRQMLERPGVELSAFDQEDWARRAAYNSWNMREAFEMFRLLREANLRLLTRLTAEEWQCWGRHSERGRTTVAELAGHMVGHDARHLEQIVRTLGEATAGEVH